MSLLLRGPEYAQSNQKRGFDLLIAHAMGPAAFGIQKLLERDFKHHDVNASVLFLQTRLGADAEPFEIRKFRTLRPPEGLVDISGLTHFMRRTGLDETAQIENIKRKEASIVGPRALPADDKEAVYYAPGISPGLRARHNQYVGPVRPGSTGSWQIASHTREISSIEQTAEERLELEIKDVVDGSLIYDTGIVIKTIASLVMGKFAFGTVGARPGAQQAEISTEPAA